MSLKNRKKLFTIVSYAVLILVGISFALPTLWMILSAFDPKALPAIKVPDRLTIDNFITILSEQGYRRGFLNSIMYSSGIVVVILFCGIFAAYPLSRYDFTAAQKISLTMLFLSSIPATALVIPAYKLFSTLNILNKPISLILFQVACSLPYSVWMLKNFFDAIPKELEEAAWADGASKLQGMFLVVIPLMIPGVITVAIYCFITTWSNFILPYILINKMDYLPASVMLYNLFGENGETNYGLLASYSMLYMAPVVGLYTISQNWMSKGFSMNGANKG